ncbi:universal stress protein [Brevibacterium sp. UCMA 11754]|uniref:universal stress protein n=1 Tax=Brevibacterium sp. UCMA 11754 TaxID=2749198 RepID=UPI001F2D4A3E|nr:universal stress protein [Brevibacterium sp. UCMA 11754]MCF2571695.1 universal stress protein [Brevibacterium sp. UCMA 11754]
MSVLVAVPDRKEGAPAVTAAIAEAKLFNTDLIVVSLGLNSAFDTTALDESGVDYTVISRTGRGDRDPAEAVLDELDERPEVVRLVIGMRRRSRVGKALIGSISQRLLLDSPVPVLAVKN